MTKKILKYMFLLLAFVALVTVAVSQGCSNGSNASTSSTNQSVQQASQQSGNGQSGGQRDPNFMKNVLAKVADKLGVSADSVTQAYQQAQSTVVPPAPPATTTQDGQTQNPPTGQGHSRPSGSDNRTGYMSAIIDKMSAALNIPADKITTAWQAAMTELRPSRTSNTPQQ
ncbi:MAG: hypothetical protein NTZ34_05590 [Chloroflexi bacterium]|nr:hypothetical protein [Chloroflexota bacterium]